jgi:hypothetical protein
MKAVRLGALIGLTLGLGACASGAPPANVSDGGKTMYIVAGGAAKGGAGGSGGSSGTGGSGGSPSMHTEPPLIFPDASYPDAAADEDAEVDAGPPQHTCDDKKKNGAETATDCGGGECDPCPDGKGCVTGDDCMSTSCGSGFTCTTPGCGDMQLNQDETDVDCGGSCDTKCKLGKKCMANEDCETMSCDSTMHCACVPTATCEDMECGVKPDGCGGMLTCPTMCGATQSCNRDKRCQCDASKCPSKDCGGVLPSGCCKSDGSCGCTSLFNPGCN